MGTVEGATAEDPHAYWVRGPLGLYRTGIPPHPFTPSRWTGKGWELDVEFLGDLLDGDTTLDEITIEDAAVRFPAAFL